MLAQLIGIDKNSFRMKYCPGIKSSLGYSPVFQPRLCVDQFDVKEGQTNRHTLPFLTLGTRIL